MGGSPKWGFFFCKIPFIKQDTNFYLTNCLSDKYLITATVIGMPETSRQRFSSDFEQFFLVKNNFVHLLTSVYNDADDADAADDADDYNRVIGIALLKAFSCAKNDLTPLICQYSPLILGFYYY